jgi:hypothetical protein
MNEYLFRDQYGNLLPNSFRWFVGQNLLSFTPWHFCRRLDEYAFAAQQFAREDTTGRHVLPVIRRQDKDDFAGFEIISDQVKENVIYFHPAFSNVKNSLIIYGEYSNLFEFIRRVVLTDMEEWAMTDDFETYKNDFKNH